MKKDLRTPLAKARDRFLASEEGQSLAEPSLLKRPELRQYLQNRIEVAWLAGFEAGAKIANRKS